MGSKRLDWIDIAKGIAMILVIVGHTVPNPSPLRHAIFSFHMPVFFILAGYTFRPKPWRELLSGSVSRLLVPYVVLALAWQVPTFLMSGAPLTSGTLVAGLKTLVFASGVDVPGIGVTAVGMAWFLAGLSAEHERLFKGPQNRHVFQLLQRHGNPAHAIAAGKSGNCRNHKPIHAAARKLKPTQRGKDKPSDTGSNKQQGLAHARLEPPLARRIANPHQQDDVAAQIQIEWQVNTKMARHAQSAKGNRGTDNTLPNNPNPVAIKQPHEYIKQ